MLSVGEKIILSILQKNDRVKKGILLLQFPAADPNGMKVC
jgi:hypothetical protein